MTTVRWSEEELQRVRSAGAVGYLSKPIRLTDLKDILAEVSTGRAVSRNERIGRMAEAHLLDPAQQNALVVLRVRNLSKSGAFLETQGPLPLGHTMDLEIAFGEHTIQARAEVVRVQEPSWFYPGGVGVRFQAMEEESRLALDSAVRVVGRVEYEIDRRRRQRLAARSGRRSS